MSYSHAGEIGDIWKHLPLCEIIMREKPKRYFESNSAYAKYSLPDNSLKEYGVFHLLSHASENMITGNKYSRILKDNNLEKNRIYYGSPALAMMTRFDETEYFFHDIEQLALKDIRDFSVSIGLQEKVTTVLGDSIAFFLDGSYSFTIDDLVFLDPYQPFDCNASGKSFFDIFMKVYQSNAKIVLWYGYNNLKGQNAVLQKLREISQTFFSGRVYTFDIWQDYMDEEECAINPGVPGCGLAVAHLSEDSIAKTRKLLFCIEDIYKDILYNGRQTSISVKASVV